MSLGDMLSAEISRALGRRIAVGAMRESAGGCIHRTLVLEGGCERWFAKLNAPGALPVFEAEADGLAALASCRAFRVPRPLCCALVDGQACLVMEWLALQPLAADGPARALGDALATLHRVTAAGFGWHCGNFVGATPQDNGAMGDWAAFFANRRLRPQLRRAAARSDCKRLCDRGERLAEVVPALFTDHRPQASLLHGDLWHGNAAQLADGTPVLFDPAVYRGDREADLAMSELFGGFPEAFYAAYREAWQHAGGYETRKTLYNLYHVLNHLNLFGAGYLRQAERMVDRLLAELRR